MITIIKYKPDYTDDALEIHKVYDLEEDISRLEQAYLKTFKTRTSIESLHQVQKFCKWIEETYSVKEIYYQENDL